VGDGHLRRIEDIESNPFRRRSLQQILDDVAPGLSLVVPGCVQPIEQDYGDAAGDRRSIAHRRAAGRDHVDVRRRRRSRVGRKQRYRLLPPILEDPEVANREVPDRVLARVGNDNGHLDEVGVGAECWRLCRRSLSPQRRDR
jgi:hypothetical protein